MVQSGKYLGMPYLVRRSKKEVFDYLKDRILKRVNGWKEKKLFATGREVLIKAVVQSISTYVMNCFQLPNSLCLEIDAIVSRYWWGQREDTRKIYWKKWDFLCSQKRVGGLGFRCLKDFNIAMLAKQGWQLLKYPNTLLGQLLKAKYFPHTSFLEVGCGECIRIVGDKWIHKPTAFQVIAPPINLPAESNVSLLIDRDRTCWNENLIRSNFLPMDAEVWNLSPLRNLVLFYGDESNLSLIVALCWGIWQRRNQGPLLRDRVVRWYAPAEGWFKINFDGVRFKELQTVGVGVIIRNLIGEVMAAMSKQLPFWIDADCAEAFAAAKAIELVKDLGFYDIILEGDSLDIVKALREDVKLLSEYGHLVSQVAAASQLLRCFQVCHVGRMGNMLAHGLARMARGLDHQLVWMEEVPQALLEVLLLMLFVNVFCFCLVSI
ncbi:uncharacterized protein LOC114270203 [Camellia sinensis]|uniref:uncharacterized protein LOC114270203 n=1 Tax=Camellia sinensis TaxID=4442 RepID=UPI0010360FEF|nr:uncharacterized protein LOC114270203 [Camellia sinensis]